MRRVFLLLLLPLMVALAVLPGCEGTSVTPQGRKRPPGGGDEEDKPREPLVATGYGTITGRVVYDGTPPVPEPIAMGNNQAACHAGATKEEVEDQKWLVKNGGVKNVLIMLQPPAGKFFDLPEEQQKPKETEIKLTQPHCAFIPRVFVLFPSFYQKDGTTKPTGQQLVIFNNAPFDHNYNIIPGGDENRGGGNTLRPGTQASLVFNPQSKYLTIQCDIHKWMLAFAFILDHPYAAVTKDDGTFVLENAPLGVPVRVVGWHEAAGFFNGGEDGTPMTFQGNQVLSLPAIKAKTK